LWVVGQEESWQNDRVIEIELEATRRKLEDEQKATAVKPRPALSAPKTALQLFINTQRNRFREVVLETKGDLLDMPQFTLADAARALREIWKSEMTNAEKQAWKDLLDGKRAELVAPDEVNRSRSGLSLLAML
jgi:D-Tyr-tRNAtyr deacylase